jgi:hypothetical protein
VKERRAWVALAVALLSGCALPPPAPGSGREDVLRTWGRPTARYGLPAGERLEYATGPNGRTTWMIDVDGAGRVVRSRQVLNELEFEAVQAASLTAEQLLHRLGTPGERRGGGYAGGQVWSWRYPTNDCLWFQASVADDGRVTSSAYGIDPACDARDTGRD